MTQATARAASPRAGPTVRMGGAVSSPGIALARRSTRAATSPPNTKACSQGRTAAGESSTNSESKLGASRVRARKKRKKSIGGEDRTTKKAARFLRMSIKGSEPAKVYAVETLAMTARGERVHFLPNRAAGVAALASVTDRVPRYAFKCSRAPEWLAQGPRGFVTRAWPNRAPRRLTSCPRCLHPPYPWHHDRW